MPERTVIIDTGPLVAYLNGAEEHHAWTVEQFRSLPAPLVTCEPVLTEAFFLLHRVKGGAAGLFELMESGTVMAGFTLQDEREPVAKFVSRYASVPSSLADACLVRMSELFEDSAVLTFDSDFTIYRKNGRQRIPLIMPPA